MHRRHHPVQHRQHFIGKIHRPVRANVHLGTAKNGHRVAVLQPLQQLNLSPQPLRRQAVGNPQPLRMVGNRHILVAHPRHRGHHRLQRKLAVAPVGMHMQVAPQVARRHQIGQMPVAGRVNLVGAPPQLRRNPGQPQPGIERRLIRKPLRFPALNHRNAIFIKRQPHPVGIVPQPNVVLLAAREILQHRPNSVRFRRAQVNLYPRIHYHRRFGLPLRQRFAHRRQARQCRPGFRGIVRHGDKVNIANRFFPAPQRPGRRQA